MSNVVNFEVPNPLAVLVDNLGKVRDDLTILKAKEKMYKEQLLRFDEQLVIGKEFSMMIKTSVRNSLDSKSLKEEYGLEWYSDHCVEKEIKSIVTTRK